MARTEVLAKPSEHGNMGMSTFQPRVISAVHAADGRDQRYFADTSQLPPTTSDADVCIHLFTGTENKKPGSLYHARRLYILQEINICLFLKSSEIFIGML